MRIELVLKEVVRRCELKLLAYSKAETFTLGVSAEPNEGKPVTQFMRDMKHAWVAYKDIDGKPSQSPPFIMSEKQFPPKADDLIEILCNFFSAEEGVIKVSEPKLKLAKT